MSRRCAVSRRDLAARQHAARAGRARRGGFAWYERGRPSSKLVALVAALAALAVAGRVFSRRSPTSRRRPTSCCCPATRSGRGPGFVVGAIGALVSNFFLGQGPWTPWQMLGWGADRARGSCARGMLSRCAACAPTLVRSRVVCALRGLCVRCLDGPLHAARRSPPSAQATATWRSRPSACRSTSRTPSATRSCAWRSGPASCACCVRFRRRFEVELASRRPQARPRAAPRVGERRRGCWRDGDRRRACCVPPQAAAAGRQRRGARYLERAQNADGGFGGAPRPALERADHRLGGARARGGGPPSAGRRASGARAPIDFMRARRASCGHGRARAHDPRAARRGRLGRGASAGRDLVGRPAASAAPRRVVRARYVNWTAFGVLALRAAGRSRALAAGEARAELARPPAERRRRLLVRDRRGAQRRRRHRRRAAGAGGRRGDEPRAARGARCAYLRERRTRTAASGMLAGSALERPVDCLGGPGAGRGRRDPARVRRARRAARRCATCARSSRATAASATRARARQTPVWVTAQALAAVERQVLPAARRCRARSARQPAGRICPGRRAGRSAGKPRLRRRAARRSGAAGPAPAAGQRVLAIRPHRGGDRGSPAAIDAANTSRAGASRRRRQPGPIGSRRRRQLSRRCWELPGCCATTSPGSEHAAR